MTILNSEQQVYWLALARSKRVGPATFMRLLDKYGDAKAAYDALPQIAQTAKAKGYTPYPTARAHAELQKGYKMGLRALFRTHSPYPNLLSQCPNAPAFLWARGQVEHLQRPSVAMVGARNASSAGQRLAKTIATDLGQAGYAVISGMARGIDQAAHHGALPYATIAILAGGADYIYPQENRDLYHDIAKTGLILSEQPIGLVPQARHFPQRNRIIAGLARGVLVLEGAARSGSLITARDSADLGREVMAIPGNPLDARASGCNQLIRDGASLIRNAQDVIELLGAIAPEPQDTTPQAYALQEPTAVPPLKRNPAKHSENASQHILSMLSPTAISEDRLIRDTGFSPTFLTQHLIELELAGQVTRLNGGRVALAL